MKPPNQQPKYTIFLAMGFAMGLGVANFFATGDNDGKATVQPAQKAQEPHLSSATLNTPKKLAANLGPASTLADETIAANAFREDISLSETVTANEDDVDVTEPSPEELAKNQPTSHTAMPSLGPQETDELESRLREESENAAPETAVDDEGLLKHEKP
jgi:hypothetical protein